MSVNHCIINLLTSEGRRRMRYYLMCDMSIIPPSHLHPFCMWLLAINTTNQQLSLTSWNTFFSTGQTHDWCTVHPSSSLGARITLDLTNSSNLFVIFITLTLRLRPLLIGKPRVASHSFLLLLPSDAQTAVITIRGNYGILKWMWEAVNIAQQAFHLGDITVSKWGDWCHSNAAHQNCPRLKAVLKKLLLFAVCCRYVRCLAVILFAMLTRGMKFTKGKFSDLILHPLNLAKQNSWRSFVCDAITT